MNRFVFGLCLSAALLGSGLTLAHHGWGSYDAGRIFTIASPVEHVEWTNPHVHLMLRHENKSWAAVLAPPSRMETRGLQPEMIKPGTQVSVEGYPSTRGETEMRAERITVAGKTYELR
jgi:hypothetical protein